MTNQGQVAIAAEDRVPFGTKLAFTNYVVEYGEISTYPADYKENAGIFCHNNPWIMIGETKSQHILGIQPDYNGLVVDPCIPAAWKQFTVHRRFCGVNYCITVKNPDGVCKGVKKMVVDGDETAGQTIPLLGDHCVHDVVVVMG